MSVKQVKRNLTGKDNRRRAVKLIKLYGQLNKRKNTALHIGNISLATKVDSHSSTLKLSTRVSILADYRIKKNGPATLQHSNTPNLKSYARVQTIHKILKLCHARLVKTEGRATPRFTAALSGRYKIHSFKMWRKWLRYLHATGLTKWEGSSRRSKNLYAEACRGQFMPPEWLAGGSPRLSNSSSLPVTASHHNWRDLWCITEKTSHRGMSHSVTTRSLQAFLAATSASSLPQICTCPDTQRNNTTLSRRWRKYSCS